MKHAAVLFDLDETLMFEETSNVKAYEHTAALAQKACGMEPAALIAAIRDQAERLWQDGPHYRFLDGVGLASWEGLWSDFTGNSALLNGAKEWVKPYRFAAWQNALKVCGFTDDKLAQTLADYFYQERRKHHVIFPETYELLTHLQPRYKLAIITNGSSDIQWNKINAAGIESFFDVVIVSAEQGIGKPDKRIFEIALAKVHAQPENAVMIGNSLCRDIQGAKNAGIRSILIKTTDPENSIDITPDAAINNLNELPPILANWLG